MSFHSAFRRYVQSLRHPNALARSRKSPVIRRSASTLPALEHLEERQLLSGVTGAAVDAGAADDGVYYFNNFESNTNPLAGLVLRGTAQGRVIGTGGEQALQFNNSGLNGLTAATIENDQPLPKEFLLSAEVTSLPGENRWLDGFLIFDYKSDNDFKYAGMFTGQNQWLIGHFQGDFNNRLAMTDWDDVGKSIDSKRPYVLQLHIRNSVARLRVDGTEIVAAQFGFALNQGKAGVASYNAVTRFDNLQLLKTQGLQVEYTENFNNTDGIQFDFNKPANFSRPELNDNGRLVVDTSGNQGLGAATHLTEMPLSSQWKASASITAVSGPNRWQDGFIIFDYVNDNNFKYAGMFTGQKQWVIGEFRNGFRHQFVVDGDSVGRAIRADQYYNVQIEANGSVVKLIVNGKTLGVAQFDSMVNQGAIGVGAYNAVTRFDNFRLEVGLPAGATRIFPYSTDFNDGTAGKLEFVGIASWAIAGTGTNKTLRAEKEVGSGYPSGFALLPQATLPHVFDVEVEMRAPGPDLPRAGIVFDYKSPSDYKFVAASPNGVVLYDVNISGSDILMNSNPRFSAYVTEAGAPYTLHMRFDGNTITIWVDRELMFSYTFEGKDIADGRIGLNVQRGTVHFDNFKLAEEFAPTGLFDPSYRYGFTSSSIYEDSFLDVSDQDDVYDGPGNTLVLDDTRDSHLAAALLPQTQTFPAAFEISTSLSTENVPGKTQNGFIVFDYKNKNDFKYAGMLADENQWVVGHYKGNFNNRLLTVDWDSQGRQIETGKIYQIHLDVDQGQVEMRVDTELIGIVNFNVLLNYGRLGLAAHDAKSLFEDLFVSRDVRQGDVATLPYYDDRESVFFINRETVTYRNSLSGYWKIDAGDVDALGAGIVPTEGPLPLQFHAEVAFKPTTRDKNVNQTGFLIFDYKNENDFKYAGVIVQENLWIVGHYQGDFNNRLVEVDWDAIDREVWPRVGEPILLEIEVDGANVDFLANGESIAAVSFSANVNTGRVGYAVYDSDSDFKDLIIELDGTTPSSSEDDSEILTVISDGVIPVPEDGGSVVGTAIEGFVPTSGVGRFAPLEQNPALASSAGGYVVLGDLDEDGDLDAVKMDYSDSVEILWNEGKGFFNSKTVLGDMNWIEDVDLFDINNDGHLDIVVVEEDLTVWMGNGKGEFVRESLASPNYGVFQLGHFDVDSDGDKDLLLSSFYYGTKVFLNDGSGGFLFGSDLNTSGRDVYLADYRFGDLNGDGFVDLVLATTPSGGSSWGGIEIHFNDGTGRFVRSETFTIPGPTYAIDLGDIDGDGDLDAVVATRGFAYEPEYGRLLLNDGAGKFEVVSNNLSNASPRDVTFGDLDADGDLDIFLSTVSTTTDGLLPAQVLLNDGAGNFTPSEGSPGVFSRSHVLADVNGDGSLDAFLFSSIYSQVWINSDKITLPHLNDFEGPLGGLQGITLGSPSTSEVVTNGDNGYLRFDNTGYTGLSTATMETYAPLPEAFHLSADINTSSGPNRWADGFLIFDYKNENDFKYAGMLAGQNQWIIGHFKGAFENRRAQVDWDDTGRDILTSRNYEVEVQIYGKVVRLFVDGEFINQASFGTNLNAGTAGVASYNALTGFDNVELAKPGEPELAYFEDFESDNTMQFQYNFAARFSVKGDGAEGFLQADTSGGQGLGVALYRNSEPISSKWRVEADVTALKGPNRWQDGFIVFDYKNANNFKYAGMFTGQNEWVIGHYLGDFGNRLLTVDGDDLGYEIFANVEYHFELEGEGSVVRFSVNGIEIGEADFGTLVNNGKLGIANFNAVTNFDNFKVHLLEGAERLNLIPYLHDFEDGKPGMFSMAPADHWIVTPFQGSQQLQYKGSNSDDFALALLPPTTKLPKDFDVSVDVTAEEWNSTYGGIVFDYHDEGDYKVVFNNGAIYQIIGSQDQLIALSGFARLERELVPGATYTTHVSFRGKTVEVTVDGEKLTTFTFLEGDTNDGQIGLRGGEGAVYFDNFKLAPEVTPTGQIDLSYYYNGSFTGATGFADSLEISDDEAVYPLGGNGIHLDGRVNGGLVTALIPAPIPFPEFFDMSVEMTARKETGLWLDGFMVFDYRGPNDFKYAGMFAGQNEWVIGHYQGNFGNRLLNVDWDDIGREIEAGTEYRLHLEIDSGRVTMRVNTEVNGSVDFGIPLNQGKVGLANYNAHTLFNEFYVSKDVLAGGPIDASQLDEVLFRDEVEFDVGYTYGSTGVSSQGNYETVTAPDGIFGAGIVASENNYPTRFYMAGSAQFFVNGFFVFDYKNANDFKYAGGFAQEDQWVVGHYQGSFDNPLFLIDLDDIEGREIDRGPHYFEVFADGANIEFMVDGELIADVTFNDPVNDGRIGFGTLGFGTFGSRILVEDFIIAREKPQSEAVDSLFRNIEAAGDEILV